jgi:hypothetical protein
MLKRILSLSVVVVAPLFIGMASPGIAAAEPAVECSKTNPRTGACLLWVSTPGDSGTAGNPSAGGCPGAGNQRTAGQRQ